MHQISTVVFDLGGVLIDWNPRYLFSKLFTDKADMEYFLQEVCSPTWNAQMDAGKPFAEAVAELTAQFPAYALPIEAYYTRWPEMLNGTIEGTVQQLYALSRSKKYRMLALTNWSAETLPVAYRRYPLFSCFESIVVSGDVRLAKPDAAIFEHLVQHYHVNPTQAVFIDDSAANIQTAHSLGFHTVHFQNPIQLDEALHALGVRG